MFVFFWLCFSRQVGVFADELKSESVKEGGSVTLQFNVTGIQSGDEIMWTFGTNGPLLAKTDGVTVKIPDDLDVRFRDRLKLDIKTGSLTIKNIRTEHAGDYEAHISLSSSETKHRFNVTVYAAPTTPGQQSTSSSALPSTLRPTSRSASRPASQSTSGSSDTLIVQISAAAAAGFLLIVAAVGIFIFRKHRKTDQQVENREDDITYANPTFYKRDAQTVKQDDEVVYAAVVTRR